MNLKYELSWDPDRYPPQPNKLKTDIAKFAHAVEDSGAKVARTTLLSSTADF